jgi:hypothetical protein
MSVLHWGDDDMHYSDNSHRWIAPADVDQGVWDAAVRAHLAQHLNTMGGPVRHDERRESFTRSAAKLRAARLSRRGLRLVASETALGKAPGNGSTASGGGPGETPAA